MIPSYQPGRYVGVVVDYALTEARTGTPMFTLRLRVVEQLAADGTGTPCAVSERTCNYPLTEKSISILQADLRAIGVDLDSFGRLDPQSPGAINLYGVRVPLVCSHETYEGQTRERWRIARPLAKAGPEAVRGLDERLGHLLRKPAPPTSVVPPAADC